MIEGLKVTIQGLELIKLCSDRSAHHDKRVAAYAEQIEAMKKNGVEGSMQFSGGDPIKALTDKLESHHAESRELDFIANHINPNETYILSREDLHKIGITRSRF